MRLDDKVTDNLGREGKVCDIDRQLGMIRIYGKFGSWKSYQLFKVISRKEAENAKS